MSAGGPRAFSGWTEHHAGAVARTLGEVDGRAAGFGGAFPNAAITRASGVAAGGAEAGGVRGMAQATGLHPTATTGGAASVERSVAARAAGRSDVETRSSVYSADNLADMAAAAGHNVGLSMEDALHRIAGFSHAQTAGRVSGARGDLSRVVGATSIEEEKALARAEGFGQESSAIGLTPGEIAGSAGRLDALYQAGEVTFDRATAGSQARDEIQQSGAIRRYRQAGEARGAAEAGLAVGKGQGDAAYSAAAFDAERHVVGNEAIRSFLSDLGVPQSAFFCGASGDLQGRRNRGYRFSSSALPHRRAATGCGRGRG